MTVEDRISWHESEIERLRNLEEIRRYCYVCGYSEDEGAQLTDITVIAADGEEGHSDITMYVCENDLANKLDGLAALGFVNHQHGSTTLLEDESCAGFADMTKCPRPTHYGKVFLGRTPDHRFV